MPKPTNKWTDAELKAGYERNKIDAPWDGKISSLGGSDSLKTIRAEKEKRMTPGDRTRMTGETAAQTAKDIWMSDWPGKAPNRPGDKYQRAQRERDDRMFSSHDEAIKNVWGHHINGPDAPHPNTEPKKKPGTSQDMNM